MYGLKGDVPDDPEFVIPLGVAESSEQAATSRFSPPASRYTPRPTLPRNSRRRASTARSSTCAPLAPLDTQTILASVAKTRHAVVVHESWNFCGIGAEVAALLADEGLGFLDGPVKRVGAKHVPIPFSPPLENYVLP